MSGTHRLCVMLLALLPLACSQPPHPMLGAQAPDIKLQLLDGGSFDLAKHRDKDIVILDFWASWCGPCRAGMPVTIRVANEYANKGVVLYAVNLAESPETIRGFLTSINAKCTVALDSAGQAGVAYGANSIPQTVIIDKTGRIRAVHVGFGPGMDKTLRHDLDELIAGRSLIQ